MLATSRERRSNAGAKMSQMLEDMEDCDDFYKSTYGGFQEEADDKGFESPAESESDYVDSDFDLDEADEPAEDDDTAAEATAPKKHRLTITKSYKEPVYMKTEARTERKLPSQRTPKADVTRQSGGGALITPSPATSEKKLRASTVRKSVASERRREAVENEQRRRRSANAGGPKLTHRRLTQQEILDEAKVTEKLNLRSLARYQQYELEMERKRRAKLTKHRQVQGPLVRYHSTTMPALRKEDTLEADQSGSVLAAGSNTEKVSRNFITFTDDRSFYDTFCAEKRKVLGQQANFKAKPRCYCVVTGYPAKYIDPLTKLPYATLEAFRVIRNAYYEHVKQKGDRSNPAVRLYLETNAPNTVQQTDSSNGHA